MSEQIVMIKPTVGKQFSISFNNETTVGELKILAEPFSKIPCAQQKLFLKGKALSDSDILSIKGVTNGATLLLTKGGPVSGAGPLPTEEIPAIPCMGGCGFFGNPSTGNFCSKCLKNKQEKEEQDKIQQAEEIQRQMARELVADETMEPREEQSDRTKCWKCCKKIGLLGVQCRCGYLFCPEHRYAETHECEYDYKTNERRKLRKQNPVVVASKLDDKP